MVLQRYIAQLILNYAKRYIRNIEANQKLSLWGGDMGLNNLELRPDLLQQELGVSPAFVLSRGCISELRIHIPWTNMSAAPVEITFVGVECVLTFDPNRKDANPPITPTSASSSASRLSTPLHSRTSSTPKPSSSSDAELENDYDEYQGSTWASELVSKIMSNLVVRIENLSLSYVEGNNVGTLHIGSITMQSTDQQWRPAFMEMLGPWKLIRKVVDIKDISLHVGIVNLSSIPNNLDSSINDLSLLMIQQTKKEFTDADCLFKNICISTRIKSYVAALGAPVDTSRRGLPDPKSPSFFLPPCGPAISIDVHILQNINICITSSQLQILLFIARTKADFYATSAAAARMAKSLAGVPATIADQRPSGYLPYTPVITPIAQPSDRSNHRFRSRSRANTKTEKGWLGWAFDWTTEDDEDVNLEVTDEELTEGELFAKYFAHLAPSEEIVFCLNVPDIAIKFAVQDTNIATTNNFYLHHNSNRPPHLRHLHLQITPASGGNPHSKIPPHNSNITFASLHITSLEMLVYQPVPLSKSSRRLHQSQGKPPSFSVHVRSIEVTNDVSQPAASTFSNSFSSSSIFRCGHLDWVRDKFTILPNVEMEPSLPTRPPPFDDPPCLFKSKAVIPNLQKQSEDKIKLVMKPVHAFSFYHSVSIHEGNKEMDANEIKYRASVDVVIGPLAAAFNMSRNTKPVSFLGNPSIERPSEVLNINSSLRMLTLAYHFLVVAGVLQDAPSEPSKVATDQSASSDLHQVPQTSPKLLPGYSGTTRTLKILFHHGIISLLFSTSSAALAKMSCTWESGFILASSSLIEPHRKHTTIGDRHEVTMNKLLLDFSTSEYLSHEIEVRCLFKPLFTINFANLLIESSVIQHAFNNLPAGPSSVASPHHQPSYSSPTKPLYFPFYREYIVELILPPIDLQLEASHIKLASKVMKSLYEIFRFIKTEGSAPDHAVNHQSQNKLPSSSEISINENSDELADEYCDLDPLLIHMRNLQKQQYWTDDFSNLSEDYQETEFTHQLESEDNLLTENFSSIMRMRVDSILCSNNSTSERWICWRYPSPRSINRISTRLLLDIKRPEFIRTTMQLHCTLFGWSSHTNEFIPIFEFPIDPNGSHQYDIHSLSAVEYVGEIFKLRWTPSASNDNTLPPTLPAIQDLASSIRIESCLQYRFSPNVRFRATLPHARISLVDRTLDNKYSVELLAISLQQFQCETLWRDSCHLHAYPPPTFGLPPSITSNGCIAPLGAFLYSKFSISAIWIDAEQYRDLTRCPILAPTNLKLALRANMPYTYDVSSSEEFLKTHPRSLSNMERVPVLPIEFISHRLRGWDVAFSLGSLELAITLSGMLAVKRSVDCLLASMSSLDESYIQENDTDLELQRPCESQTSIQSMTSLHHRAHYVLRNQSGLHLMYGQIGTEQCVDFPDSTIHGYSWYSISSTVAYSTANRPITPLNFYPPTTAPSLPTNMATGSNDSSFNWLHISLAGQNIWSEPFLIDHSLSANEISKYSPELQEAKNSSRNTENRLLQTVHVYRVDKINARNDMKYSTVLFVDVQLHGSCTVITVLPNYQICNSLPIALHMVSRADRCVIDDLALSSQCSEFHDSTNNVNVSPEPNGFGASFNIQPIRLAPGRLISYPLWNKFSEDDIGDMNDSGTQDADHSSKVIQILRLWIRKEISTAADSSITYQNTRWCESVILPYDSAASCFLPPILVPKENSEFLTSFSISPGCPRPMHYSQKLCAANASIDTLHTSYFWCSTVRLHNMHTSPLLIHFSPILRLESDLTLNIALMNASKINNSDGFNSAWNSLINASSAETKPIPTSNPTFDEVKDDCIDGVYSMRPDIPMAIMNVYPVPPLKIFYAHALPKQLAKEPSRDLIGGQIDLFPYLAGSCFDIQDESTLFCHLKPILGLDPAAALSQSNLKSNDVGESQLLLRFAPMKFGGFPRLYSPTIHMRFESAFHVENQYSEEIFLRSKAGAIVRIAPSGANRRSLWSLSDISTLLVGLVLDKKNVGTHSSNFSPDFWSGALKLETLLSSMQSSPSSSSLPSEKSPPSENFIAFDILTVDSVVVDGRKVYKSYVHQLAICINVEPLPTRKRFKSISNTQSQSISQTWTTGASNSSIGEEPSNGNHGGISSDAQKVLSSSPRLVTLIIKPRFIVHNHSNLPLRIVHCRRYSCATDAKSSVLALEPSHSIIISGWDLDASESRYDAKNPKQCVPSILVSFVTLPESKLINSQITGQTCFDSDWEWSWSSPIRFTLVESNGSVTLRHLKHFSERVLSFSVVMRGPVAHLFLYRPSGSQVCFYNRTIQPVHVVLQSDCGVLESKIYPRQSNEIDWLQTNLYTPTQQKNNRAVRSSRMMEREGVWNMEARMYPSPSKLQWSCRIVGYEVSALLPLRSGSYEVELKPQMRNLPQRKQSTNDALPVLSPPIVPSYKFRVDIGLRAGSLVVIFSSQAEYLKPPPDNISSLAVNFHFTKIQIRLLDESRCGLPAFPLDFKARNSAGKLIPAKSYSSGIPLRTLGEEVLIVVLEDVNFHLIRNNISPQKSIPITSLLSPPLFPQVFTTYSCSLKHMYIASGLPNSELPVILTTHGIQPYPIPDSTGNDILHNIEIELVYSSPAESSGLTDNLPYFPLSVTEILTISINIIPLSINIEDKFLFRLLSIVKSFLSEIQTEYPSSIATSTHENISIPSFPSTVRSRHLADHNFHKSFLIAQERKLSNRLSVHRFSISSVKARVTLKVGTGSPIFLGVGEMPVALSAISLTGILCTSEQFVQELAANYLADALIKSPLLIGSLDLLGNPTYLLHRFSRGLHDLLYIPSSAAVQGPRAFSRALIGGVHSLLRNIADGTLTSVAGFTSSIARNVDRMSPEDLYTVQRQLSRQQKPHTMSNALYNGLKAFSQSVIGGAVGIVTTPLNGASNGGTWGFVHGMGAGLVGAVAKPLSGVMDFVAYTSQSLVPSIVLDNVDHSPHVSPAGWVGSSQPRHPVQVYSQLKLRNLASQNGHVYIDHLIVTSIPSKDNENLDISKRIRHSLEEETILLLVLTESGLLVFDEDVWLTTLNLDTITLRVSPVSAETRNVFSVSGDAFAASFYLDEIQRMNCTFSTPSETLDASLKSIQDYILTRTFPLDVFVINSPTLHFRVLAARSQRLMFASNLLRQQSILYSHLKR